jgi:predicted house-cleaning noncanonical NTP pyrophosphatase (MazG superfamily)
MVKVIIDNERVHMRHEVRMRVFNAQKLVRDNTQERLEKRGIIVHAHQLDNVKYEVELRKKLLEEADEVARASSVGELIAEIADVCEVIEAICRLHNIAKTEIDQVRQEMRDTRGGFEQQVYISTFEVPSDSEALAHYLEQPHKYPEIKV